MSEENNVTPNQITFHLDNEQNVPEEIIKMSKEGFFFKGERIDDIHNVYERFNEWLTEARKRNNLE